MIMSDSSNPWVSSLSMRSFLLPVVSRSRSLHRERSFVNPRRLIQAGCPLVPLCLYSVISTWDSVGVRSFTSCSSSSSMTSSSSVGGSGCGSGSALGSCGAG